MAPYPSIASMGVYEYAYVEKPPLSDTVDVDPKLAVGASSIVLIWLTLFVVVGKWKKALRRQRSFPHLQRVHGGCEDAEFEGGPYGTPMQEKHLHGRTRVERGHFTLPL